MNFFQTQGKHTTIYIPKDFMDISKCAGKRKRRGIQESRIMFFYSTITGKT